MPEVHIPNAWCPGDDTCPGAVRPAESVAQVERWKWVASTLADALFRLHEFDDREMAGVALQVYEAEAGVTHLKLSQERTDAQ